MQEYYVHLIIIFLYVYDLLIIGSIVASILVIKTTLHNAFEMSDLGILKQFPDMYSCLVVDPFAGLAKSRPP